MLIKEFIELLSKENPEHELGFVKILPHLGDNTELLELAKTDGKHILDMRTKEQGFVKRLVLLCNPKDFGK